VIFKEAVRNSMDMIIPDTDPRMAESVLTVIPPRSMTTTQIVTITTPIDASAGGIPTIEHGNKKKI